MDFYFKNENGLKRDTIIFARQEQIFTMNWNTEEVKTVIKFDVPLNQ